MKTKKWLEKKLEDEKEVLKMFEQYLEDELERHKMALVELHKFEICCCNIKIELLNEILDKEQ